MAITEMYIDGAAKGNPGPAGIGVIILKNGLVIKNISRYIGEATNNTAEYSALICGLQEAARLTRGDLRIMTDSELLCRQMNGQYRVKSTHLQVLYKQAQGLLGEFGEVLVQHIPREQNKGADKLANLAVRGAVKKETVLF